MKAQPIDYCIRRTALGQMLVAATARGVCFVHVGGGARELRHYLARELPFASFRAVERGAVCGWADQIVGYLNGRRADLGIPLDVRGSRFQKRVWTALREIPKGETRAYSQIAERIGCPRSARAVARACATNPTPILTPCHRVIAKNGGLSGYALGVRRKQRLLELEGAFSSHSPRTRLDVAQLPHS